ncbi:MAG TPA: aldehyde dehydrogenase family protein [Candidatus Limnocylindrales bacterium]|jgi:betaine-aldehyde dehydrogenase|nr:aldehyde dehydrogenase family protein [Candidatus Limnocylindrales bacterium]
MTFPNELFLNGAWRGSNSRRRSPLVNPATEETFAEVAAADAGDVQSAVESAQKAWESGWRDLSPGKRSDILFNVARALRDNIERIAQLEMIQIGKPISDARDEAALGARVFEFYAGAVTKFCGQTIPVARGGFDFTLRQSMGVVACIVPWNFPFPIACWKAAPALAAGNCVVLKPASISPLTALALGEIAHAAGLPAGVLQVISGPGGTIGEALTTHPLIRKVSFTGSTSVGQRIMELASRDIKRISLELGGKSPNIIFADADWQRAAETSPMSVFANTGQDCCARSRLFVEQTIFEPFVEKFVSATRKLVVGDPNNSDTQLGPLVSASQRVAVEEYLGDARNQKSRFACGGGRPYPKGYYLEPTVLLDVGLKSRCWREEIFGPVVCITSFTDEAQMIKEVNATPYGLSGSLWTNDLRRALRVARAVESGVLSINSHSSVHVEAPFGGYKQSGLGRDLGMAAMEGYTEVKNVYVGET